MPDFRMAKLGKQLSDLRTARGLSQQKLADLADKDKPLIIKYEKGRHNRPSLIALADIAVALGMNFLDIREFLLTQLPPEESPELYEETVFQLELPFDAVTRISCRRVGNRFVVNGAVQKKRKKRA